MDTWMLVVGGLVVAVTAFDAITTTLAASTSGGPIARRVGDATWGLAKRLSRGPRSAVLVAAGPLTLVLTFAVWMGLLWAGWAFVLSAEPRAVVASSSMEPASGWQRIYFTGYSIFTLGNGDFQPQTAPWMIVAVLVAATGLGLATLGITYLVQVITAVTERRRQAATISGFGSTAQEIVTRFWDGTSLRLMEQPLFRLANDIGITAQRHLTYPVLHFFHSRQRRDAFATSVAALDEALTIIASAVDEEARPRAAAIASARSSVEELLGIVDAAFDDASATAPPLPDLGPVRDAGVPVCDDATFRERLDGEDCRRHRRRLHGFATGSTWPWEAAVQPLART